MHPVRRKNRRTIRILLGICFITGMLSAGCGKKGEHSNLLLSLSFQEGQGNLTSDSSGNQADAEINYLYQHAVYTSNKDPQWRETGKEASCLLFDGASTYLSYPASEINVEGESFSISVWAAPRMFEWDDPNAAEKGEEQLTGIISQYNREKKEGILLGYQRFGRLAFEVGTGEEWITVWGDNLSKYQWNQITAVFDGENGLVSLYLNGTLAGQQKIEKGSSIAPATKEKLYIGKNSHAEQIAAGTYHMFSGLLDEVQLYGSALTESEVREETEKMEAVGDIAFSDIWLEDLLTDDVYKTQYHGGPYQFWMNEPHAPLYYNGMYHLFYQSNMTGTYWRNICWGHLVSTDMVHWTPIKEAITPTEDSVVPDGVWSGGATTDVNGVPVLFFTAGNDSFAKEGLRSNQNIGTAYPADLTDPDLTDWIISDELAVEQGPGQGRAGEFRDPHIWKEGDTWCMLVCSGSSESNGGSALLYETGTLEVLEDGRIDMDWKYMGLVYEMENQTATYGTSWELPILLPLQNEAGTKTKYIFMISPAPASTADNKIYYFLGDFDVETGKFTPDEAFDNEPALLDYGSNVFTGPSAFVDPSTGKVCLFSIMQDQRSGAEEGAAGWAHCVGLTRELWLNQEGTDVQMAPSENLASLEKEVLVEEADLTIEEANQALQEVKEDMVCIKAVIDPKESEEFGIQVKSDDSREKTTFTYKKEEGTINGYTSSSGFAAALNDVNGALELKDGKLELTIYIDRSLVEAYFNDTKSITMRSYSDPDALGISFFAEGEIRIDSLKVSAVSE